MADSTMSSGNPWLDRIVGRVVSEDRTICLLGPATIGFRRVANALDKVDCPLIWVDLSSHSGQDPIDAGVRFADAVRYTTKAQLIPYGLGLQQSVIVFDKYVELLGPFTIVITGMEGHPGSWEPLSRLNRGGTKVVLCASAVPQVIAHEGICFMLEEDLKVTRDDAIAISHGQLQPADLERILRESEYRFDVFSRSLSEIRGMPNVPGLSEGSGLDELLDQDEIDPTEFAWALYRRRRYIEAFQLACTRAPDLVSRFVDECGEAYFQRGMFERFLGLLNRLPDSVLWDESLLRWRFSAAMTLNLHAEVLPDIERYLADHEAPELRAQFAAARPSSDFLEQTTRAVAAKRTPVTMRHHAFALSLEGRVADSLETSRRALRLADLLGQHQLVVAIATDISTSLLRTGEFSDARWWAEWACSQYFELGLNERFRRLIAVAALVYAKILVGDEIRLADLVAELEVSAESMGVPSYEGVVTTVADYQSVFGNLDSALELYRANFESVSYEQAASASVDLVRCLCDLGHVDEAVEVGRKAVALARGASNFEQGCSWLSAGIALRHAGDKEALEFLQRAQVAFSHGYDAARNLQTVIQLGLFHLEQGSQGAARSIVQDATATLQYLGASGWRLLGGTSSKLAQLRQLAESRSVELDIRLLGDPRVFIGGKELPLGTRTLELLAVLACSPEGTDGEVLAARFYGDNAVMNTLKAAITRLRTWVPVTSRPYRIAVPYRADFLEIVEQLGQGKVRQALGLYRGPLMPKSTVPAIEDLRTQIDEGLRQAVLQSEDGEAMLELARRADEDDLELLESAYKLIPRNDPQSPLLRARIRQVRKDWQVNS